MMNEIIRTNLPNIKHNIYLKKQTNNNNKKNGESSMLKPNDKVRIKFQEKWKKGIILKKKFNDQDHTY